MLSYIQNSKTFETVLKHVFWCQLVPCSATKKADERCMVLTNRKLTSWLGQGGSLQIINILLELKIVIIVSKISKDLYKERLGENADNWRAV